MTAPTELMHKLQLQSGTKLWLINVPQTLAEELAAGAEIEIVGEKDVYDGVVAFFDSPREVDILAELILADMPPDGLLWVGYRKGDAGKSAGLTRDVGWEPFSGAGWRPVRQIAIDEEWSALRFRPKHLVKSSGSKTTG